MGLRVGDIVGLTVGERVGEALSTQMRSVIAVRLFVVYCDAVHIVRFAHRVSSSKVQLPFRNRSSPPHGSCSQIPYWILQVGVFGLFLNVSLALYLAPIEVTENELVLSASATVICSNLGFPT